VGGGWGGKTGDRQLKKRGERRKGVDEEVKSGEEAGTSTRAISNYRVSRVNTVRCGSSKLKGNNPGEKGQIVTRRGFQTL